MTEINRRDFIRIGGICLVGSLVSPTTILEAKTINAVTKKVNRQLMMKKIKRALEPELDPLTKKIIQIESQWKYWAKGKKGEIGLMQIKPIVLKEWNWHGNGRIYNKYDLFDPFINVNMGKWYLHERIGEHYLPHYKLEVNDENKAASYNAGPPTIGDIGDAKENFHKLPEGTQNYLRELRKLS